MTKDDSKDIWMAGGQTTPTHHLWSTSAGAAGSKTSSQESTQDFSKLSADFPAMPASATWPLVDDNATPMPCDSCLVRRTIP